MLFDVAMCAVRPVLRRGYAVPDVSSGSVVAAEGCAVELHLVVTAEEAHKRGDDAATPLVDVSECEAVEVDVSGWEDATEEDDGSLLELVLPRIAPDTTSSDDDDRESEHLDVGAAGGRSDVLRTVKHGKSLRLANDLASLLGRKL
jgi:hypothetical protein